MTALGIVVYEGSIEDIQLGTDDVINGIVTLRKRLDTDVMSQSTAEEGGPPRPVSTVEITSETEAREFISCRTLLMCSAPDQCDVDLFSAVKDCGLVFDGGIVVDKVGQIIAKLIVSHHFSNEYILVTELPNC